MAIAHVVSSGLLAYADTVAPYANQTTPSPGGATGDLILAVFGIKPYSTSISDPAEYTACGNKASGTTAQGNGTGSMRAQAYWKVHDGSESSVTGVYSGTYNPTMNAINAFSNTTNLWSVESTDGADETTPDVSITGAAQLDFAPGDWVVVVHVTNDNTALPTGVTITVPGCVVGTITERLPTNATATGNDGSLSVYTAEITSGNASGAPTFAGTGANSIGPALFIRLHEVTEFTRTVAIAGTGTIATAGTIPGGATTFERTAAIAGTGSIATAATFWSTLSRAAAVSGTGTIATAATFWSTLERTAAVAGTGGIATAGTFWSTLERTAALSGTGGISVSGGIVGGVTVFERTAAVAGTGSIATAATFWSTLERTATVAGTSGIATAGTFWSTLSRAASIAGTGSIATTGTFLSILERAASLTGTGGIATRGHGILERAVQIASNGSVSVSGARTVSAQVSVSGTGAVTVTGFLRALQRAVSLEGLGVIAIGDGTRTFADASTWRQAYGNDWTDADGTAWIDSTGNAWESTAQDGWTA